MLAEIETALRDGDPKFAARFRDDAPREKRIGTAAATALCVAGFTVMVLGLACNATLIGGFPWLSVVGYLMVWGGAARVVTWGVLHSTKRLIIKAVRWAQE